MKMNKKLLFAATAFVVMAAQAVGQERKLSDELKVVKLTSNDVNLRQQPSEKSARLIKNCGGEGPCIITWSAEALQPKNSWGIGDEPQRAKYLNVVETVKGDDGENWLHCFYTTNIIEYVRWDVYVMEKYTKPVVRKPLFVDGKMMPETIDNQYFGDVVLKITGDYKDWFVGVSWDDMESIGYLYIGRYEDGALVVGYEVPYVNAGAERVGSYPLYIKDGMLYFDKTLSCADCYLTGGLDLHKLCANQNFLSRLMKICAIKDFEAGKVFFAVEGEDEWIVF